jgi:hypothetical protein
LPLLGYHDCTGTPEMTRESRSLAPRVSDEEVFATWARPVCQLQWQTGALGRRAGLLRQRTAEPGLQTLLE